MRNLFTRFASAAGNNRTYNRAFLFTSALTAASCSGLAVLHAQSESQQAIPRGELTRDNVGESYDLHVPKSTIYTDRNFVKDDPKRPWRPGDAPQLPWDAIRADIRGLLYDPSSERNSFAPLVLKLAWNSSCTWSEYDHTGGSYGATMLQSEEREDPQNAGLGVAIDLLEPLIAKYPGLSHGDLWSLAGCVALETMGGPHVDWRGGRRDLDHSYYLPRRGRIPSPEGGPQYLRTNFERMGLYLNEGVALMGVHAVSRSHGEALGYPVSWASDTTRVSNEYYRVLINHRWEQGFPEGTDPVDKEQLRDVGHAGVRRTVFHDRETRRLGMTPADLALVQDPVMQRLVVRYAANEAEWRRVYARAFTKLIHQGVPIRHMNED
eukprot:TRINITY_DN12293_c0_g1_i1.p1 TRINITY_DN12293_c0_g1~~TRINITY_DN12293_c0_g1_i1.p1  ORF type:complete len:379 (+),score=55.81 TRINITY_DN12293_c0_g1_i1:224-1360(+)